LAFVLIGAGVGACGTSLLALLASRVGAERRAAAATIVWLMMIFGMAVTAGIAGSLLDPFSVSRLVAVSAAVSVIALAVTCLAVWGVEARTAPAAHEAVAKPHGRFPLGVARGLAGQDRAPVLDLRVCLDVGLQWPGPGA
jgi:BCD family chlorophyll transporter-like MFS transporter